MATTHWRIGRRVPRKGAGTLYLPRRERAGGQRWVAGLVVLLVAFLVGIGLAAGVGYFAAHGLAVNSTKALIVLVGGLGGLLIMGGLAPLGIAMATPFFILLYYPLGGLAMLVARKVQRKAPGVSASPETAGYGAEGEEKRRSVS